MKRPPLGVAAALLALAAPLAAGRGWDRESSWQVRETRPLRETFPLAVGSACHLLVDNVEGSIAVAPSARREIVMRAEETVRARDTAAAAQARAEVRLDIDRRGDTLELFVDGPFRCSERGGDGWRSSCGSHRRDYAVAYDFTLEVPDRCDLDLSTVNGGELRVRGVSGAFEVRNVNGGIVLESIGGSGSAHTVNGAVEATFSTLPDGALDFETVNGDIDVSFDEGLSADFLLKTFSGEMWSEFGYTSLPVPTGESRREGGRFVYSQRGETAIRVGRGGQRARLVTLNGDISIRRHPSRGAR
jgi:hypothetical protein